MRATLQSIFKTGYEAYRRVYWAPDYIHKAAWSIMNCRTSVLGGHRQVCPEGHFERNHYNSCGHAPSLKLRPHMSNLSSMCISSGAEVAGQAAGAIACV